MKFCNKCKIEKPISEFHRNRYRRDGFVDWCKPCSKASLNKIRWGSYGLTKAQFEFLLDKQEHRCAICQTLFLDTSPVVDHDHRCCPSGVHSEGYSSRKQRKPVTRCGKCVRGLLCKSCNAGLGMFKDDVERMISAINYLKAYKPEEYLTQEISLDELEIPVYW